MLRELRRIVRKCRSHGRKRKSASALQSAYRNEVLEERIMLFAVADGDLGEFQRPVHETFGMYSVDVFAHQFGKSTLSANRSWFELGTRNEDMPSRNPYGQGGIDHPSVRHFWNPDGGELDGLFGFDSAVNRAMQYLSGGIGFNGQNSDWGRGESTPGGPDAERGEGALSLYETEPATAFYYLGHAAHLLQDMSVPAHVHDDAHLEGFGPLDDPDPFHDWIDGQLFTTDAAEASAANRPVASFRISNGPRWSLYVPTIDSELSNSLRKASDIGSPLQLGGAEVGAAFQLFFDAAEVTDNFDSTDFNGEVTGGQFRNRLDEGIFDVTYYNDWAFADLDAMSRVLVPQAVRSTAELFRAYFAAVDFGDDGKPVAAFSEFKESTEQEPAVVSTTNFRVTVLATDQDNGDSGIGKDKFKFRYQEKAPNSTGFSGWKDASPDSFAFTNGELRLNSFHFDNGGAVDTDFASKHGALAQPVFKGKAGYTYRFEVTVEDGAGNTNTEESWVRVGGVDVVTVIDRSGSMGSNGKLEQAKNAASTFVDVLQTGDKIGVVSYDSGAGVNFALTAIDARSVQDQAKAAIGGIRLGGNTSIGSGVQVADNELDRFPDDQVRAMIVLTDGQQNAGAEPIPVINAQVDPEIRIFTVGLGADADSGLLAQMAQLRNGRYFASPSGSELQSIYTLLLADIKDQGLVLNQQGTIQQGESYTAQFQVDPRSGSITIGVNWPGSDLDLELIAPDGTVIGHSAAVPGSGIELIDNATFESFTIQTPLAGLWSVRVIGVDVPSGPEPFNLFVNADTAVTSTLQVVNAATGLEAFNFATGDELLLRIKVGDPLPLLGADVVAQVTLPNGKISRLILADGGGADDAVANDGTYSARFKVTQSGTTRFDAAIRVTTSLATPFSLIERGSIFATGPTIPEPGQIIGRKWHDVDSDGVADPGEPGLNGWDIEVVDANGVVVAQTTSMDLDLNADGTLDPSSERGVYYFTNLPDGTYTIREVLKAGWQQTFPVSPAASKAFQLDSQFNFKTTSNDFQNWAGLNERWLHANNGWHYVTPSGGLFRWISGKGATLKHEFVASLTPGIYANLNLLAAPAPLTGHVATIAAGNVLQDLNFGNTGASSVQGQLWEDANRNGLNESGERPLNGRVVNLVDAVTGTVISTTTTGAVDLNLDGRIDSATESGVYQFSGVVPGKYRVEQAPRSGWQSTNPDSELQNKAYQLDSTYDFDGTNGSFHNWGSRDEKWLHGASGWFFITPDGSLWKWNQSPRTALTGTLVGTLSPYFYSQPTRLTLAKSAQDSIIDTTASAGTHEANLGSVRTDGGSGLLVEGRTGASRAGNVIVAWSGKDLRITGDQWNNQLGVFLNHIGQIVAVGLQGTTINGQTGAVILSHSLATIAGNLVVNMNQGDDLLTLQGLRVAKSVSVNEGNGVDSFIALNLVVGGSLNVNSGYGAQSVLIRNTTISNNLTIWGSEAGDNIVLDRVVVSNSASLALGAGADNLFAIESTFHDDARVNLGGGIDRFAATRGSDFKRWMIVDGAAGRDEVDLTAATVALKQVRTTESQSIGNLDALIDSVMATFLSLGLDLPAS